MYSLVNSKGESQGRIEMFKILFLTILLLAVAVTSSVWSVINIALDGSIILSVASTMISFVTFISFFKMLEVLHSVVDARKLARKLNRSRARSFIS